MKFSKVLEYLKDIRVLSILLIAIFILGFAYSKCTEGMTVEQLEQTRDDFDQSIHDPSFNELSEEEKRAAEQRRREQKIKQQEELRRIAEQISRERRELEERHKNKGIGSGDRPKKK